MRAQQLAAAVVGYDELAAIQASAAKQCSSLEPCWGRFDRCTPAIPVVEVRSVRRYMPRTPGHRQYVNRTEPETAPNTSAVPARTKRRNSTRLTVSGAALAWAMIGTAGIVGLATWAITVAVARPHTAGIGAWISDFAKSSGLAGVLAVVAALIAFFGLNLDYRTNAERKRAALGGRDFSGHRRAPCRSTRSMKRSRTTPY